MRKVINFIFVFIVTVFFTACGGGGGGTPPPDSVTLNGIAVDNYISGATVCIDTNKDNDCSDESISNRTTTFSDGTFTFENVIPTDNMVIIAYGGRDADTNETFPYIIKNLATNIDSNDKVILSSLNTLVTDYKLLTNKSLDDSKVAIANFIASSSSANIIEDVIAKKSTLNTEFLRSLKIFQMVASINDINDSLNSAVSFKAIAQAIAANDNLQHDDTISVIVDSTPKQITNFVSAPVFMDIPRPTVQSGTTFVMNLDFIESPDGGTIGYSLSGEDSELFEIESNKVYFKEIPENTGTNTSYSFNLTATIGTKSTQKTLIVSLIPGAPKPIFDSFSVAEDNTFYGTLTATDTEGSSLTYSIESNATHGTVSLDSNGTFSYTPTANYYGSDSFTYRVHDGTSYSATQTVTITVTSINDAPTISGTPVTSVNQDVAYSFTPTASDIDAGTTLTFSIENKPSWADFNTSTGKLSGTPTNSNVGTTSGIVISVYDGNITISLSAFNLTVVNVNDAPVPTFDSFSTNEDTAYNGTLTSTDIDSSTITYSIESNATHGTVSLDSNGAFSYTPNGNYHGSDSFTYKVYDGSLYSSDKNVSITVTSVNDAPIISGTPNTYISKTSQYIFTPTVSDVDNNSFTYSITNKPLWADFNTSTGTLSGTPVDGNESNATGIIISVSDGNLSALLPSFSITVTAVNNPPVDINLSTYSVNENTTPEITLSTEDNDSTVFVYSFASGGADNGYFTITDDKLTFNDAPNFEVKSLYSIKIKTEDDLHASFPKDFNITINNINDVATFTTTPTGTTIWQGGSFSYIANIKDSDVGQTLTAFAHIIPTGFEINATNGNNTNDMNISVRSLQSGDNMVGTHNFVLKVIENNTSAIIPQLFSVTIQDVNDAPTSGNLTSSVPGTLIDGNLTISPNDEPVVVVTIPAITDGDIHLTQTVTLTDFYNNNTEDINATVTDSISTNGTATISFKYIKAGKATVTFKLKDDGSPIEEKSFSLNVIARGSGWDLYKEQKDSGYDINTTTYDGIVYDWNATKKWYESTNTILLPIKNITDSAYLGADLNISNNGHYSMNKNKIIAESTVYPSSSLSTYYTSAKKFLTADGVTEVNATDNKFAYDGNNTFFVSRVPAFTIEQVVSYNDNPSNYCSSNYGVGWRLPTAVEIGNTNKSFRKYGEYIAAYVGDTSKNIITNTLVSSDTLALALKQDDAGWIKIERDDPQYFRCVYQP